MYKELHMPYLELGDDCRHSDVGVGGMVAWSERYWHCMEKKDCNMWKWCFDVDVFGIAAVACAHICWNEYIVSRYVMVAKLGQPCKIGRGWCLSICPLMSPIQYPWDLYRNTYGPFCVSSYKVYNVTLDTFQLRIHIPVEYSPSWGKGYSQLHAVGDGLDNGEVNLLSQFLDEG